LLLLAHDFLGRAFEQQGKRPEAIAEFQRARQLEGAVAELWAMLGHAYAVSGQGSEAQKALAELKDPAEGVYVPPYMLVPVPIKLIEADREVTFTLYKLIKFQAPSAKSLPKP